MSYPVGTSGFSYPQWKGAFYPEKLPQKKMLEFYASHFSSVEINSTFYRMPKSAHLERWGEVVPETFKFAFKAPRRISHQKRLEDCQAEVEYLFRELDVLGDHLGPVLFQPPPFLRKDVPRLQDFLAILPTGRAVAFEFRHDSWFDDEVYEVLRDAAACLCISDRETGDDREVPFLATCDWGYVRLRREHYETSQLRAWAHRVREQWPLAYVYFMHEDEGEAPGLARQFLDFLADP